MQSFPLQAQIFEEFTSGNASFTTLPKGCRLPSKERPLAMSNRQHLANVEKVFQLQLLPSSGAKFSPSVTNWAGPTVAGC